MFEKGNKYGRRFKPGESGNPNGRPAIASEVRRWAKKDVSLFYKKLKEAAEEGEGWAVKLGFQLAGVPLTEDKVPEKPQGEKPLTPASTEDDLLQAATGGEQ